MKPEHIDKIVKAYTARTDIDKYAHKASIAEIIENDWNMNIPRYVNMMDDEEEIDIEQIRDEIKELQEKQAMVEKELESRLREIGINV